MPIQIAGRCGHAWYCCWHPASFSHCGCLDPFQLIVGDIALRIASCTRMPPSPPCCRMVVNKMKHMHAYACICMHMHAYACI